jgi:hypothetical protein
MPGMTNNAYQHLRQSLGLALFATALTCQAGEPGESWKDKAISPVANPIFFEDPRITSEVRPIFMQHWLPDTFKFEGGSAPLGGDVRVYAVQLRYALTDRLGLIATKDGYIEFKPDKTLDHGYGFADLAAGLKYALVDNEEQQLIVTPGVTFGIPTGDDEVGQGDGDGEFDVFVSAAKGWDKWHLTGNAGVRLPIDDDAQTMQLHYSLQVDYYACDYFIPFVVLNGYTVLSDGNDKLLGVVNLNTEMYDLINFGSTEAKNNTMLTVGGGFRSRLCKCFDLGAAYEVGVSDPEGIFDSRVTVDFIWRF